MTVNKEYRITFQPSGRTVYALPGTILIEAAARAGCVIDTPCGGAGKCGKCAVRIVDDGKNPASKHEAEILGEEKISQGFRLACGFHIQSDLTVQIPESALFQSSQKILSEHGYEALHIDPLFDLTAIDGEAVGAAFDIGTTTIVGTLIDLRTGAELALASAVNSQTTFGDDVVSRIKKCMEEDGGLEEMSGAVRKTVNELLAELSAKSGLSTDIFRYAAFAGNTAMQQILAGIDPAGLGEIPFEPAFKDALVKPAGELGFTMHPAAQCFIFPQIGGFVGGDTVSGILATRLADSDKPTLMVDVGTNGEIVLAANGRLLAASVAAGPAFEGARIINGMRASNGAIEKVVLNGDDIKINVIGNVKPTGICGTGLIDAVAVLLRKGIIDITGRIMEKDELPDDLPRALKERIVEADAICNFVLADSSDSGTGEAVILYQRDIRELQLANAAIRAGINILLKKADLSTSDLDAVLLAGAFGNFIRRSSAKRIGMLPQIDTEQIRFVGNVASFGAKRVLLSKQEADLARELRSMCEHVELSSSPEFQEEFGAAMIFPDSD